MTLPVLRFVRESDGNAAAEPLRGPAQLHQRMSRLMTAQGWTPPADLTETDDAYLVEIEVPGVRRKDLTVEVTGDELRVSGKIVEKEKIGWLRHRTRRVGRFDYRTMLPDDIDLDHVSADLAEGVLAVRVPKTEAARPRRIAVSVGSRI